MQHARTKLITNTALLNFKTVIVKPYHILPLPWQCQHSKLQSLKLHASNLAREEDKEKCPGPWARGSEVVFPDLKGGLQVPRSLGWLPLFSLGRDDSGRVGALRSHLFLWSTGSCCSREHSCRLSVENWPIDSDVTDKNVLRCSAELATIVTSPTNCAEAQRRDCELGSPMNADSDFSSPVREVEHLLLGQSRQQHCGTSSEPGAQTVTEKATGQLPCAGILQEPVHLPLHSTQPHRAGGAASSWISEKILPRWAVLVSLF